MVCEKRDRRTLNDQKIALQGFVLRALFSGLWGLYSIIVATFDILPTIGSSEVNRKPEETQGS